MITEKREDGKVVTEATIKVWVEGERYVQHRRGQRPGQRARHRAARRDHRPPSAPGRHRADQLQGPHPRRAPRHRRGHAGAARLLRRRAGMGLDRRLGEHHRGLLGGAGGLARIRVSAARESAKASEGKPAASAHRVPASRYRSHGLTWGRARASWSWRYCESGRALAGAEAERVRARLRRLARRPTTPWRSPAAPRRCISESGRWAGARGTR